MRVSITWCARFRKAACEIIIVLTILLTSACSAGPGSGSGAPEKREQWLFLGNSITQAGHYVDYIETWFLLNQVNPPEITDLGLSSETVSCLSEPDHPFPRPCLHGRLDRVLEYSDPDLVFACYGMNCGIYHPFSENRFTAYKDGINQLVEKVNASGARLILLTPPPYAGRIHARKPPAEGESYGYRRPAADYNETLARYAEWILSLDGHKNTQVIDIRPGLEAHMVQCYPDEPVHPALVGHKLMAESILSGLEKNTGSDILTTGIDPKVNDPDWNSMLELVKQQRETYDRALLNHLGHDNPGVKERFTIPLSTADSLVKPIQESIVRLLEAVK